MRYLPMAPAVFFVPIRTGVAYKKTFSVPAFSSDINSTVTDSFSKVVSFLEKKISLQFRLLLFYKYVKVAKIGVLKFDS